MNFLTNHPKEKRGSHLLVLRRVCYTIDLSLIHISSSQTSEEAVQRKRDAFAQLKAGNPDTIGWIQIPNTVVDYPVMQSSKDNPCLLYTSRCV